MGVPYKIVDPSSKKRFGVVVSSLKELIAKAQEKFSITTPIRVLLESDGTQVDDEEYFSSRKPDTSFVILKSDENYEVPSVGSTSKNVSTKEKSASGNGEIASGTSSNQVLKPVESSFSLFSSLPLPVVQQVISRVLKYLSLEDRNSVRLACRLWNDICCKDPYVYQNEKLVFRPFDDIDDIASCLLKSKRKFLNVEFHLNELYLIPNRVWKICGPKLLSIIWYESTVAVEDGEADYDEIWSDSGSQRANNIHDIICHCTRLEYFGRKLEYWYMGEIVSDTVLKKLLDEKIVRDNMKGLSESFTFANLENPKKFKVFPKLTNVTVSDMMTWGKEAKINLTTLPSTVTKLKLVAGLPCSSNCLASLNSRVMLTELIISLEGKRADVDRSLLPFFTRQTGLEKVRLQMSEIYVKHEDVGSGAFNFPKEVELFKAKLVVHVLKSCPKLKVLDIVFIYSKELIADTDQQDICFAQLFGERVSKLECLSLANFDFTKLLPSVLPERSNLKRLQFPETDSSCVRLLREKMFHNLQFIDLPKCNLAMLKTISECLVSLRALRIERLSEALRRPKKKTVNEHIERLKVIPKVSFKKLEHLEVYGGSYPMLLVFNQFHFPILKHFIVSDYEEDSYCDAPIDMILECLPQRAPHLEMLHLNLFTDEWITESSDLKFVKLMPKLQIFAFGPKGLSLYPTIEFVEVEEVFEMCLSLRVIIYDDTAFFYDREYEEVEARSLSYKRAYEKSCYAFKEGTCCKFLPNRKNEEPKYFS